MPQKPFRNLQKKITLFGRPITLFGRPITPFQKLENQKIFLEIQHSQNWRSIWWPKTCRGSQHTLPFDWELQILWFFQILNYRAQLSFLASAPGFGRKGLVQGHGNVNLGWDCWRHQSWSWTTGTQIYSGGLRGIRLSIKGGNTK